MNEKHYTTGQLAVLFQVAPRTVSKWFDSGALEGFRIPGSSDRRVPKQNAIKFAKENGISVVEFDSLEAWMLLVTSDAVLGETLIRSLPKLKILSCTSGLDAGLLLAHGAPLLAVLDLSVGADAQELIRVLGTQEQFSHCKSIAILPTSETPVDRAKVLETYKKPIDGVLLAERIRDILQLGA